MQEIGGYAFIAGVVLAVLAAFVGSYGGLVPGILVVLGLIVGWLNIHDKEADKFVLAALMIAAGSTALTSVNALIPEMVVTYVNAILGNVAAFVVPAGLVVALKIVKNVAHKA